jgi:hypothetical protein
MDDIEFIRVVGEELILHGYPAGDRSVTLANLRALLKDNDSNLDYLATTLVALHEIVQWSNAYPLSVFPEPDLAKARELLEAGGMTLGSVSAHCMRHVITGVGEIARKALSQAPPDPPSPSTNV